MNSLAGKKSTGDPVRWNRKRSCTDGFPNRRGLMSRDCTEPQFRLIEKNIPLKS